MNNIALKQNFITEFYSFYFQNTNDKQIEKDNPFIKLKKKIHFKYFDKDIKELYKHHRYGAKRFKY